MNRQPENSMPRLFNGGRQLPNDQVGRLRQSNDISDDIPALRRRMAADGYLFMPGYLDREEVKAARADVLTRLAADGCINTRFPLEMAVPDYDKEVFHTVRADLAGDSTLLQKVLYSGAMMTFFNRIFGAPVRHYDYTWLRVLPPSEPPTFPHYDIVYMGRGTDRLYTAWTPLTDIDFDMSGLAILENSHQFEELKEGYARHDADSVCENESDIDMSALPPWYRGFGRLADDIFAVNDRWGGGARWLTSEYRMGDLLVFSMYTLHAGLDNRSESIRLSTDSRYQLAAEPVDERWIGAQPPAHGPDSKRAMIC